jgi:uncharacterized membrane protein YbaN (DUF454 family)
MPNRVREFVAPLDVSEEIPAQGPIVVHSVPGRVRLHLPNWSGRRKEELLAMVRAIPGVVQAEANGFTANLLLRFRPDAIHLEELLDEVSVLRLRRSTAMTMVQESDLPSDVPSDLPSVVSTEYATGVKGIVYRALGWTSVGLAVVGAIMPGIPTTPFVLLAAYFFMRSSPEAHEWLRNSRVLGPILRDWEERHGVRRSVQYGALGLIAASMVVTIALGLPLVLTSFIVAMELIGLAIVAGLPVIDADGPERPIVRIS